MSAHLSPALAGSRRRTCRGAAHGARSVVGGRRLPAVALCVAHVVVALLVPRGALGQDAVTMATDWLRTQQDDSGAWAGHERLSTRDTVEGLRALELVAPGDAAVASARDALSATASVSVDLEARRLEALSGRVPSIILDEAVEDLSARAAPDGGWGLSGSFDVSDSIDTALALRALLVTGSGDASTILSALARIEALQDVGGGFAHAFGEPPDLVTTAEVVHTLAVAAALTDVSDLLAPASAFLLGA